MINTEPCPSYYLPGVSLSITAGQTSSLPTLPERCPHHHAAMIDRSSLLAAVMPIPTVRRRRCGIVAIAFCDRRLRF